VSNQLKQIDYEDEFGDAELEELVRSEGAARDSVAALLGNILLIRKDSHLARHLLVDYLTGKRPK
jgi:hypothetical protein